MGLILDGCKLPWHRESIEKWRNGKKFPPIEIEASITTKCTYRCIYCSYGKMHNDYVGVNMDKEVIMNFLEDAAEIGVKAVSFLSDGESTCNPWLCDAIVHGKKQGLDMALGTNGYLLDESRLVEILPALTFLKIHISAADRERYAEIHGCDAKCYDKVISTVERAVKIKKENGLDLTIGLQMVLLPGDNGNKNQVMPLSRLGREMGVDYLVIKHCSDNENINLKIDYSQYFGLKDLLKEAENCSTENYLVKAKWSKILSGGHCSYDYCYGTRFIAQLSGHGIFAPCGALYGDKYKEYQFGNVNTERLRDMFRSERYEEVLKKLEQDNKENRSYCTSLCLQHNANEYLWKLKQKGGTIDDVSGLPIPQHINFI